MSTLKVTNLQHPSAVAPNLVLSSSGGVAGAGLDLITTETASAVSSVSINGCFSALYANYSLLINGVNSGSSANWNLRMRSGGTDNTNSQYNYGRIFIGTTVTTSLGGETNQTIDAALLGSSGDVNNFSNVLISEPFATAKTVVSSQHSGRLSESVTTILTVTTSYDGFTFFPASGTFTGTIRVYGHKD